MGTTANVRAMTSEVDCGCGCHLEGRDEQCLSVKVLLHMEAAHPEIEEPTIELAEEVVTTKAYVQRFLSTRSSQLFSQRWKS